MKVLGIESTCDETSASIVIDGKEVLCNVIATQIKDHAPWAGVVPEIASRLHLVKIVPVIEEALKQAQLSLSDIDLVAASNRPGLIGGLMIGVSAAKSIAFTQGKPYIGINHIEAHLYSPHLTCDIPFPYIGVLTSGGHTMFVIAKSYTEYEVIGTTIDDAVGEAFDKIAKHYGVGYPGGPIIEKLALTGDEKSFDFPIANLYKNDREFDVSYSGIKTAVINHLDKYKKAESYTINDIAASFQRRAFDILYKKVKLAVEKFDIHTVVVAGGVSANKYLRKSFDRLSALNCKVFFPELKYATDNGAMVAGYAYHKYSIDGADSLDSGVSPRVGGFKISLMPNYKKK